MKKLFYFLFVAILCVAFAGCSKDDEGHSSKLVGTWKYSNVTLIFNSDGTGQDVLTLRGEDSGYYFKWKETAGMLHLTYDGSGFNTHGGYHVVGTTIYYYILENGVLSLWYADDGEFRGGFIIQ